MRLPVSLGLLCLSMSAFAGGQSDDKFRQIENLLPTPTSVRAPLLVHLVMHIGSNVQIM